MNEMNKENSSPSRPALNHSIPFHPWVLFGIFFVSNTLLAYFPLSLSLKCWIGAFGLLIPFLLTLWDSAKSPSFDGGAGPIESHPFHDEFLPAAWFRWTLPLAILALVFRFWNLTTLSVWPLCDEAMYGSISQRLMEGEPLRWSYGYNSIAPMTFGGLALFFKVLGVSMRTLWLFPAVLSVAALFFYGWAARNCFSKSFAFLFLIAVGLSFWPIFIGRFALFGILLFLWEGISLGLFILFLKKPQGSPVRLEAIGLGLAVGTGFYIYHTWFPVALALGLAMALACLQKTRKDFTSFFSFSITAGGVFVPLAWNLGRSMDWTFIKVLWVFQGTHDLSFVQALLKNLSAYFWGPGPLALFTYNPLWGGFLNPVTASFFFLGLVECARFRTRAWTWILFLGAVILWLPQALSRGQEYMRAVQLIPVFLVLLALGARRLVVQPPWKHFRPGLLALALLGISVGCDSYHLFGAYHHYWTVLHDTGFTNKSLERQRAFQLFDNTQRQWGPGLILGDLMDDIHDQSLGLAAWEFNALENPKVSASRVPWAGILCNVHYRDYLARLFPKAQWTWLASDVLRENGGLMAGIIPLEPGDLPTLQRWARAEKAMHVFAGDILNAEHSPVYSKDLSAKLEKFYPLFQGDPFLESSYWEKQAQNAFLCQQYADMVLPLQNAIRLGVPEAHLYNRLGVVYLVLGDFANAKGALDQALKYPDNQTTAAYLYSHFLEPKRLLRFP